MSYRNPPPQLRRSLKGPGWSPTSSSWVSVCCFERIPDYGSETSLEGSCSKAKKGWHICCLLQYLVLNLGGGASVCIRYDIVCRHHRIHLTHTLTNRRLYEKCLSWSPSTRSTRYLYSSAAGSKPSKWIRVRVAFSSRVNIGSRSDFWHDPVFDIYIWICIVALTQISMSWFTVNLDTLQRTRR